MKKLLAFDIDDTLNVAKTPMTEQMAQTLAEILDYYEVCIISGQKLEQFLRQIIVPMIDYLNADRLNKLHLMVAQGTQYYRYKGGEAQDALTAAGWHQVYSHSLREQQVKEMFDAIEKATKKLGLWCEQPDGDIIENRNSQVTYSALGQSASPEVKYPWDPDHTKRKAIIVEAKKIAPQFDYEIGGTTSINVFLPGMNKQFGMTELLKQTGLDKSDILYFGDMTEPGGNDYPVVQMGIDTITVAKWQDTDFALKGIIGINKTT